MVARDRRDDVMKQARELTPEEIEAGIAKTKAETIAALSEASKNNAEARKFKAEAAAAECAAREAKIKLGVAEEVERTRKTSDVFFHTYYFGSEVNATSVRKCIEKLSYWHRTEPTCDIEIVFNSPGGGIIEGMELFDYIRHLVEQGHSVTTMAMGYAASMGGILLQAGSNRVMGKQAVVLIHEAAFMAIGKVGDVEDTLELVHMLQANVLDIFAERAKATGRSTALTRTQFQKRWRRKDWWIPSSECFKYGIVDEVR